jgi:hypothetical protein
MLLWAPPSQGYGQRKGQKAPGALGLISREDPGDHPVTNPDTPRHIEMKDGDQTVAAAEVTTSQGAEGTVRASLYAAAGPVTPGRRADLVDAVMDSPEVQASERLEATIGLGDGESLQRLRERTEDTVTRAAGSTALVDADIPPENRPGAGQQPGGETSGS